MPASETIIEDTACVDESVNAYGSSFMYNVVEEAVKSSTITDNDPFSELMRYLNNATALKGTNPLVWWRVSQIFVLRLSFIDLQ